MSDASLADRTVASEFERNESCVVSEFLRVASELVRASVVVEGCASQRAGCADVCSD